MADTEGKGKEVVDESGPNGSTAKPEEGPQTQAPSASPTRQESEGEPDEGDEPEESDEDPAPPAPKPPGPKLELSAKDGDPADRPRDYTDPVPVPFWDPSELSRWSLWRAGIAEFIGTFLLLYITLLTVIGNNRTDSCDGVGDLGIAFAFGFTVFILVYALAGISGGHLNTAITFAFLLARRISLLRALLYMVLQVLGALAGAGLVKATQKGYYQRYGGGANYIHNGYSKGAGFVAELLGTFLLLYVVFAATDPKRKTRDSHIPVLAPLAIGSVVFVLHLATLPITGTGINPARSFAAASLWDHHSHAWHDHWIFWVAPLLGATLAGIYYQLVIRALPFRFLPGLLGGGLGGGDGVQNGRESEV